MAMFDEDSDFTFLPPVLRVNSSQHSATFLLGRNEFLKAAEKAIGSLRHPLTGQPWIYDGYRSDRLFLVMPMQAQWGIPRHTVELNLVFEAAQTTVFVTTTSVPVMELYFDFCRAMTLVLAMDSGRGGQALG